MMSSVSILSFSDFTPTAVFVNKYGIVQLGQKIAAKALTVLVPQCFLLRFFLRGESLLSRFAGKKVYPLDLFFLRNFHLPPNVIGIIFLCHISRNMDIILHI